MIMRGGTRGMRGTRGIRGLRVGMRSMTGIRDM